MGLVVGKDSSRIVESWEIGKPKPRLSPMATNSETQNPPQHKDDEVRTETKAETPRTPAAEKSQTSNPSPVIARNSYGAMMKIRLDRDLKRYAEQKGNKL